MIKHSTEKQRIPNGYNINHNKIIETKNYGKLTEHQLYYAYFYPMLVKSTLKSNIETYSKVPYKISIEIDEEKLNKLAEKEKQFYKDSLKRESLNNGFSESEINIYKMVTEDLIYLL